MEINVFGKKKSSPALDDNDQDVDDDRGFFKQDDTNDEDEFVIKKKPKKDIGGIIVTVVVILAVVAGAIFGVLSAISPSKGKCSEQLEALQAACNGLTYFELRDFISTKKSNEYNALIYSTEMTDEDKEKAAAILDEDVFGGFLTRAAGATGTTAENVMRTMVIDPTHFSGPGKEKVVTCDVMSGAYTETLDFTFGKEGGKVILVSVEPA